MQSIAPQPESHWRPSSMFGIPLLKLDVPVEMQTISEAEAEIRRNEARRVCKKLDPRDRRPMENTGRWTKEEHTLFLEGLSLNGKEWKKISGMIKTRSVVQIRTHAQKYFQKLAKAREVNGDVNPLHIMSTSPNPQPKSLAKSPRRPVAKSRKLSKAPSSTLSVKRPLIASTEEVPFKKIKALPDALVPTYQPTLMMPDRSAPSNPFVLQPVIAPASINLNISVPALCPRSPVPLQHTPSKSSAPSPSGVADSFSPLYHFPTMTPLTEAPEELPGVDAVLMDASMKPLDNTFKNLDWIDDSLVGQLSASDPLHPPSASSSAPSLDDFPTHFSDDELINVWNMFEDDSAVGSPSSRRSPDVESDALLSESVVGKGGFSFIF